MLLEGPDASTTNGASEAAAAAAMIVFEDVRKVYEPDVVALQRATFVIEKGEFVFVVGPSGSGSRRSSGSCSRSSSRRADGSSSAGAT